MAIDPIVILKRLIPDDLKLYLRTRWIGGHFRLRTADRICLEETVFPWFRDDFGVESVLDVGCDWYTRSYPSLLRPARYWTIDLDPAKIRYRKGREAEHVTGSLLELDRHFGAGSCDLAICNGVIGWGVNDADSIRIAASQLSRVIRPGGWLVLGWNDMDGHRPETLAPFDAPPLIRTPLPPLGVDTLVTPTKSRHTYRFFRKSESADGDAVKGV